LIRVGDVHFLIGILIALLVAPLQVVVYQRSTSIDEVISRESKAPPRAFLWIPER
jgi:hypothetical protein